MFHQVFICETSQEVESATTEMLVEVDNLKPESLPCEEGINVKIEEENFKIEPEQSVVISTDHQIKLEVKKQPVVEEPMEVLSSPVPEGDTKVSRRKHSLKKSSVKKTNNGKSSSVYNNMYNNEQQENTNIGLKDVGMKRMAIQEVVQELKQIRDCEKNILRQYLNTVDSLSNSQVEYNDSLTLPTMKKEIKIITNSNVECITSDVIPPNNEEKTLHKTKEERYSSPSPSHEDHNFNSKNLQKTNKTWEEETNSKTNLSYSQVQSNNSSTLLAMEKQCKLINNSVDVILPNSNGGETLYNIKEEETYLSPPSHEDDSDSCSDWEEEYLCAKKQILDNISKTKQKKNKTSEEKINSKTVIVYSSGEKTDSEMRKLKRSTKTLLSHLPKEKICDKNKVLKLSLTGKAESCRNLEQEYVPSTHNYVLRRRRVLKKKIKEKDLNQNRSHTQISNIFCGKHKENITNDSKDGLTKSLTTQVLLETLEETKDSKMNDLQNFVDDVVFNHTQNETINRNEKTANNFPTLLKNTKTPVMILSNDVGDYITSDVTCDNNGNGKSSFHLIKDVNRTSSPSIENGDDSCSDWEQEYLFSKNISVNDNVDVSRKLKKTHLNKNIHSETSDPNSKLVTAKNITTSDVSTENILLNNHENNQICFKTNLKNLSIEKTSKSPIYLIPNVQSGRVTILIPVQDNPNSKTDSSLLRSTLTLPKSKLKLHKSPQTEENKNTKKETAKKLNEENSLEEAEPNIECSEVQGDFTQNMFMCQVCNKWFESRTGLSYHITYSLCSGYRRKLKYQCDICGKLFNGREKLENHKNSHVNARPHKCSDCDKCFNSKTARYMHYKSMHQNKKLLYLCCYCGITSPAISHMIAHEETHRLPEGEEIPTPFKCLQCGKGFISHFKLKSHLREHKLKKCPKCSEEFLTDKPLREHLRDVHKEIKIYTCMICSKTFNCRKGLENHTAVHSNILRYFCDICDKGFKRKRLIKQHMITHSDERPISCLECGQSYKRKTHLKQHMFAAHGKGNKR